MPFIYSGLFSYPDPLYLNPLSILSISLSITQENNPEGKNGATLNFIL